MKVVTYSSAVAFWQVAGTWLAADPVRNTVPLSLTARALHGVLHPNPILLTVHDGPDLVAAAIATIRSGVVLGAVPPEAAAAIAGHLASENQPVPRADGMRPAAEAFAAAWTERTGAESFVEENLRLYRLGEDGVDASTALTPPKVPGTAMIATEDDLDLLTDWRLTCLAEISDHRTNTRADVRQIVAASFALGNGQLLWQVDGRPVAMAAVGTPREGMSRIGPVYTPKEQRGHGYGTAVTAAAAQWALDRGADHVVLFTDLANPVSNSIYQRIGFRAVADAVAIGFRPGRLP